MRIIRTRNLLSILIGLILIGNQNLLSSSLNLDKNIVEKEIDLYSSDKNISIYRELFNGIYQRLSKTISPSDAFYKMFSLYNIFKLTLLYFLMFNLKRSNFKIIVSGFVSWLLKIFAISYIKTIVVNCVYSPMRGMVIYNVLYWFLVLPLFGVLAGIYSSPIYGILIFISAAILVSLITKPESTSSKVVYYLINIITAVVVCVSMDFARKSLTEIDFVKLSNEIYPFVDVKNEEDALLEIFFNGSIGYSVSLLSTFSQFLLKNILNNNGEEVGMLDDVLKILISNISLPENVSSSFIWIYKNLLKCNKSGEFSIIFSCATRNSLYYLFYRLF